MGHMGTDNCNVIHPLPGPNFILLYTVPTATPNSTAMTGRSTTTRWIGCNLCVAACPVGAIRPTTTSTSSPASTTTTASSSAGSPTGPTPSPLADSADEYPHPSSPGGDRRRGQSLGFGPQYKSAYCMAVCPAGTNVIGPYLADKAGVAPRRRRPAAAQGRERLRHVGVACRTGRPPQPGRSACATWTTDPACRHRRTSPSASSIGSTAPRATDITVAVRFVFPDQSACTATIKDNKLQLDDERARRHRLTRWSSSSAPTTSGSCTPTTTRSTPKRSAFV